MHILPNFRQTSSTATFKRVNKERMCRPVDFSEEFVAVFIVKMSQIDTEDDKNPKFSNFQSFYAFFVEVSTNFEDWKILKGQQGKSWSSSGIL